MHHPHNFGRIFAWPALSTYIKSPNSAAHGAILGLGIMLGAVIAHASKLGFNDMFSYSSIALIICSSIIIYIRRKQIKSIARMLN